MSIYFKYFIFQAEVPWFLVLNIFQKRISKMHIYFYYFIFQEEIFFIIHVILKQTEVPCFLSFKYF